MSLLVKEKLKNQPKVEKEEKKKPIVHEDNEWGITVEESSHEEGEDQSASTVQLTREWESKKQQNVSEKQKENPPLLKIDPKF